VTRLALGGFCVTETDLGKRHLGAAKDPRRLRAIIDRRERIVFAGKIGVAFLFVRNELVGYLALGGDIAGGALFLHHQRRFRRDLRNRLPELQSVTVPTLVVQGERDPFGGPAEIAAAAPGVTVRAVPGDHSLRADLEAVTAAVLPWLDRRG